MQVIATAGHAGHGKSTLVRALTGMDPHRPDPERGPVPDQPARDDLGFAWLTRPSGDRLAFIDVPGHPRLIPAMIAGAASVRAALFVVAADQGWQPQSAEHLAVLTALGIRGGLLVVTRADLADPGPALAQATERIAASGLDDAEAVAVSAVTGQGLPDLAAALDRLARRLPVPDAAAPVRIWVERAFGAMGNGAVVTGTLPGGAVRSGDELVISPSMRPVRIRGLQALGEPAAELTGPALAALSLRGASHEHLGRGMALVHPGRWTLTDVIDVRLSRPGAPRAQRLPRVLTLHAGTARATARVRQLGSTIARLMLREPIPLHVGDRIVLRDPAGAEVQAGPPGLGPPVVRGPVVGGPVLRGPALGAPVVGGTVVGGTVVGGTAGGGAVVGGAVLGGTVLDVAPPPLGRRGSGASATRELASWPDVPTAAHLLRRHGLLRASALLAMGVSEHPEPVSGEWLADPGYWAELERRLGELVAVQAGREPLAPGVPLDTARAALGLPDRRLVEALVRQPLQIRDSLIQLAEPPAGTAVAALPAGVTAAVQVLLADLATAPFASPDAGRLRQLGLDTRAITAAERAGLLLRVSEQIVLAPGADAHAGRVLAGLPQPFTAAEARQALRTTRRVAIPLLEFLDRAGVTERLPDDRRRLRAS